MNAQLIPPLPAQPRWRGSRLRRIIGLVVLQIVLTLFLITFLAPTFWMLSSSLKASTEIFKHPIVWIPESPQWNNYVKVFQTLPFARFAWNTFVVVTLAVLGTVISTTVVAYGLARLNFPGRRVIFGLMVATIMLPEIVTLIPRFIMFRTFRWIDTFAPLTVPFWFALTTLYVFLMHQFLRGIPRELDEAAMIDGASRWQILWLIILPLCKPVIATIAVFALIQHYNEILTPLIFLNRLDNWTMALGIRALNDSNVANWELVFAASTMMLLPVLILFIIAQRYFVQGIALTGFGGR
jgi:ABC-type glycerol-3-phosphate transport system permease component